MNSFITSKLLLAICFLICQVNILVAGEKKWMAPVITSFDASACVNDDISIDGNHFTGTTDVTINGVTTVFTINSNSSITATVPVGATNVGTISITNGVGTTASGTNFTANPLPAQPTITATSSTTFCNGDDVLLVAPSGFSEYYWYLDNLPEGGSTQLLTASNQGDYTLEVEDANGCISTISGGVTTTVNSNPTIDAGTDIIICEGQTANLNAIASGGTGMPYTYSWTPSTGLSNDAIRNPSANPTNTTTYFVTAIDGNGCEDTDDILITVNDTPFVALVSSDADNIICEGDTIIFTATGPAGTTYEFFVNNTSQGVATTSNIFTTTSLASGTRDVKVTGINNGCSVTTADISVTVRTVDAVAIIYPTQTSYTLQTDTVHLVGSPSGGVFSGNGVANDVFYIENVGVGTYPVLYSYTNANGCVSEVSIELEVNNVTPILLDENYCQNDGNIVLDSTDVPSIPGVPITAQLITLANLTATGVGITKTTDKREWTVSPSTMPAGRYKIQARYLSLVPLGIYTFTQTLTIDSIPSIDIQNIDPTYCFQNATVSPVLTQTSGTFSWTGVSGGASSNSPVLNLNIASANNIDTTFNISVNYTDGNGCASSDIQSITIFGSPIVDYSTLATEYCFSDVDELLTANQSGGIFSGAGITDNGDGTALFSPRSAFLTEEPDSTEIIFTSFDIKYIFTNGSGCTDSVEYTTDVNELPDTDLEPDLDGGSPKFEFCIDDDPHLITGNPSPAPGESGFFSGNGIFDFFDGDAEFTPSVAAALAGSTLETDPDTDHTITYTFIDINGCTNTASISLKVRGLPMVSFSGLGSKEFCIDDPAIILTGSPLADGTTDEGLFLFDGIPVNLLTLNSQASFDPETEFNGYMTRNGLTDSIAKVPIIFAYTDQFGCENGLIDTATVYDLPAVSFSGYNTARTYCFSDGDFNLSGRTPEGFPVQFTGNGISADNGDGTAVYSPRLAMLNILENLEDTLSTSAIDTITYIFTDETGCINQVSVNITIRPVPNITNFSNFSICYGDTMQLMPAPSGGLVSNFIGDGVIDNGNSTATFISETASIAAGSTSSTSGIFTNTITYSFTNTNGCINSKQITATINPLPEVNFSGLAKEYCADAGLTTLTGSPIGTTGRFTGEGIDDDFLNGTANYDPADAAEELGAIPPFNNIVIDTVTYTYTDSQGCINSYSDTVILNPLPILTITGTDPFYCYDADADTIAGLPAVTAGTSGNFSGRGITDFSDGMASFLANLAATQAGSPSATSQITVHPVTYTFTDLNGCTNSTDTILTVNPLPATDISSISTLYCYDAAPFTINGTPNDTLGIRNAIFSGRGITDFANGTATFTPSLAATQSGVTDPTAGNTTHTVLYTYTNANGCINSDSITFTVLALPNISFSIDNTGLNGNKEYCPTTPEFSLRASLPELSNTFVTFSGEGVTDRASGEGRFNSMAATSTRGNPDTNFTDTTQHIISLLYIDANTCRNTVYDTFTVNPNPNAIINVGDRCGEEPINFTGSATTNTSITNWAWNFGDGTTSLNQSPIHFYTLPDRYQVNLSATTDKGCSDDTTRSILIGKEPMADFRFVRICFNDTVFFTDLSTVQNPSVDTLIAWEWDFDDPLGTGSPNTSQNPIRVYSDTGDYNIRLVITTNNGCRDTVFQQVDILPVVPVTDFPYTQDFEIGDGSWSAGGTNSSWQYGPPAGDSISFTPNGVNAWMTNLTGSYNTQEESYVDGPCFDFAALERPMISLKVYSQTDPTRDGASLQYSLDDGQTWEAVGALSSTYNWYDERIDSDLGENNNQRAAWTGRYTGWQTARHDLDILKGKSARLRIAFGSDAATDVLDGFAFDDIWVGERAQTVLVESFSNTTVANDANYNTNTLYPLLNSYTQDDLVTIQYHLESAEGRSPDPFYEQNPADASARALFYGVSAAPSLIVNGTQLSSLNNAEQTFKRARLGQEERFGSLFDLELEFEDEPVDTDELLNLKATITANDTISGDLLVYFAVIEREITLTPTPSGGQSIYNWTFRKLLPDGAGISLNKSWNIGDQEVLRQSWRLQGLTDDGNQMGIVAFIQKNDIGGSGAKTREVLQAAYGTSVANLPIEVITGLGDIPKELQNTMLFPNPAKQKTNILFGDYLKQDMQWQVFNQLGQSITSGSVSKGSNGFELATQDLPNGMYIVQIGTKEGFLSIKLMIKH